MSRPTSCGYVIALVDIVRLNLERDGPERLRSVMALDRGLDGNRAGEKFGHRICRGGCHLGSCSLLGIDHTFDGVIRGH
jgi:hypothetical protein